MIHQPGIVYAHTLEGLELPVIDLTHPDFAIPDDPASRQALLDQYRTTTARDLRGPALEAELKKQFGE